MVPTRARVGLLHQGPGCCVLLDLGREGGRRVPGSYPSLPTAALSPFSFRGARLMAEYEVGGGMVGCGLSLHAT